MEEDESVQAHITYCTVFADQFGELLSVLVACLHSIPLSFFGRNELEN